MIVLAGGDLVLPDRILSSATLVLEGPRIAGIETSRPGVTPGVEVVDCSERYVMPGFVDVHVHGVAGVDTHDAGDAVAVIARTLPRYGVTAFCPTTVACSPRDLTSVLAQVRHARLNRNISAARVLPAHLESNFINPDYRGAQPAGCLRTPGGTAAAADGREFEAADVLETIAKASVDVGIVTMAPELPGGLDLVRSLNAAGHRVSLGHSAATFGEAMSAFDAGARHATHLFNRMGPFSHREPGLVGAVLARDDVAAELICDGYHVHPSVCRMAIRAKGIERVMAITDGTAGSGLPTGAPARLGGRPIRITDRAAVLEDGTLAGSTSTMDGAFRMLVTATGLSLAEAATVCATTPARELGLTGFGVIADGAAADLVVLDRGLRVARTFIDGVEVYRSGAVA